MAPERSALWSPEALADIDGIWNYYAQAANTVTADRIIRAIGKSVSVVQEHPYAGRARAEINPDLRSIAASPHVIFYRVRNDRPQIVRVLDGRQDIDEIFSGDSTP